MAERLGQRVGGRRAGRVRGSDPEVVNTLCPVVLVVDLGHDDLGCSGLRGYGRGPRATVMHCGGDPPEERLQVDLPDGQAAGFVVRQCHAGPPTGHDRTTPERAGRLDHRLAEVLWSARTAEAEVDRWLAGVEERLQLRRQWALVRQDPGARLEDIQVRGLGPWSQRRVGG